MVGRLIVIMFGMKLTDDQKVQIFCAVLNAHIQADAAEKVAAGANTGSGVGVKSVVERASLVAAEAIAKLMSKAWA